MRFVTPLLVMLLVIAAFPTLAQQALFDEPRVSAVYFETDLREAINELVLQTGVNIITDNTVGGTVTLDMIDVPLEKALTMMLIGGGYSYRKMDDGFYVVGMPDPRSPMFQYLSETETITLNYISPSEAKDLLPSLYDKYLRYNPNRNVITISAPRSVITQIQTDLAKIDIPQKQVLIEATVTEVSTEILRKWSMDLFELSVGNGSSSNIDWRAFLELDDGAIALQANIFGELLTKLRALQGNGGVNIKANPQVMVVDRGTAELFVGDEQAFVLQTSSDTTRIEKVNVGVSLKVQPKILSDNELQLNVVPGISHFSEEQRSGFLVRRSALNTSVFARNGETVLVAGLTLEEKTNSSSRVPIIGELPLLRWLFHQSVESEGERELLIFVTAKIVER